MIVRTWRGAVRAQDADSYFDYLRRTGFAEYAGTPGHVGTLGLRRTIAGRTEYLLLTAWTSPEAVRRFAGQDPDRAVFYPEDERFLIEADQTVGHFEPFFVDGQLPLNVTEPGSPAAGLAQLAPGTLAGQAPAAGAHAAAAPGPADARARTPGWWWRGWITYAAALGRHGLVADFR